MTGERFGPYELHSLLGRGGMGEVYRAVDTRKNRGLVALKRLPAGLADDAGFQRRFLREAELAARLRDPHVIPIHDYGEIDGRPFLDMRLVDGIDLATDLEREGPMTPDGAVAIVEQVASALDAAHREGLVHRDVKPSNIVLDRPGDPAPDFAYLIDFGIAANLMASRVSSSQVSGTGAYMAPERFAAGGDHRVDVYALGCVLFELLTGDVPFTGDWVQLLGAHVHALPPRPSTLVDGLPAGLDDVVLTALAKDPQRRHPGAGALAAAARAVLRGPGLRSPRAPLVPRAAAETRGPLPARSTGSPSPAGAPARAQGSVSTVGGEPADPRPGPVVAPPPVRPARGGPRRTRGWLPFVVLVVVTAVAIGVVAAQSGPTTPRTAANISALAPQAVAFTPDSTRALVAGNGEGTVSIADTATGAIATTVPLVDPGTGAPSTVHSMVVTPDGRRAYVSNTPSSGAPSGAVSVIDLEAEDEVARIPMVEPDGLAMSPDGRRVYVTGGSPDGGVSVVDTTVDRVVATIPVPAPRGVDVTPDGRRLVVTTVTGVALVDTTSNTVAATLPLTRAADVVVSPDGLRAYVAHSDDTSIPRDTDSVYVIDATRAAVLGVVPVANTSLSLGNLSITPDGRQVYVSGFDVFSDAGAGSVTVVDGGTQQVTATIPTPYAHGVAVAPDGRQAYVQTPSSVSVLRI